MIMKHHITSFIIKAFILIILFATPLHAQNITIRPIPSLDKLPVNAIHRIFQDSDGYMWYGTFNGLCRYDGYNIRVFRSDLYHPEALKDNYITYIIEDQKKKIWFGTKKGAYILDKSTYQITPVDMKEYSDMDVFTLSETPDGTIWISVSGALLRYNPDGSLIRKYDIIAKQFPGFVYFVHENQTKEFIISVVGSGMYKLQENELTPYFPHPDYTDIERIIWDKSNKCYWLGTWGHGIIRFNPQAETTDQQYISQPLPVDIMGKPTGDTFHMVQDDVFHYLWVTTQRDLFAFRITDKGSLEQVDISPFIPKGNKMLYEIYKDKDGKLWVSSFDAGSFIIDIRDHSVNEYTLTGLKERTQANPAITSLCIDTEGKFWFSQERFGLFLYDPDTDNTRHYTDFNETASHPFWEVPKLISSRDPGRVWAMPYGSTVYGMMQQNMTITPTASIHIADATPHPGSTTTLYEDDNSNLWIGTTTGLFLYDTKSHKLEMIKGDLGHVSGITQTTDGRIWAVIRNKGIYTIHPDRQINGYSYPKNFACVNATSDGKLWIGTDEGEILCFDPALPELADHSRTCGMQGDFINNVVVDIYNHVWIITGQMIREYNPRNGAYHSYDTRSLNFLVSRFLTNAVSYDKKGDIFFGGISGIVSIPPSQQLESVPQSVTTFISDVKVMGQSIWENSQKRNPIDNTIRLSSKDQNLSLEFSSLDFHNLDQIRYAYRMIGVDNDWNYLDGGKNSAFYNKLSKGKYTFQVKATDKNGLWSDNITEIKIHRLPAIYETGWAYLLYTILVVGIAWVILYLYLQRKKQENQKKFAEEVTQVKLRYFTNISHELLTPLTILTCLADEIESPVDTDHKRIELMQSNIKRLKRLLQQVLDFRKIESRNMKLFVRYSDIVSFVQNVCEDSFSILMKKKNITFSFTTQPDKITGYFDQDKLDKILFNLLSNAFKYTPEGKAVSLTMQTHVSSGHEHLKITVKDEGKGISQKEQDRIFVRFYNNKFNYAGLSNGIGLSLTKELVELHHGKIEVQSLLGQGTEFIVDIPIDRASYAPDELKEITLEQEQDIVRLREKNEHLDKSEKRADCTLLLVEDNIELLLIMESIFSQSYHVAKAENGKEALEYIRTNPVDLVISDIMMPEMDGLELCRHLKNDIATSHIIVVLLTAQTSVDSQIDSYKEGADDYIPKPFEPKVLRARLENLLEKRTKLQTELKKNPQYGLVSQTGLASMDVQFIEKAVQYVEQNLADSNLDVGTLADYFHMSRSTLLRKVKAITGLSPSDFIKSIKMQCASQMLKNKSTNISDVIVALGYSDHKHFTTSFKEIFGITPSEYQKQNR